MTYWTGIGSRETPPEIISKMVYYGSHFAKKGYTVRSGAANGADTAFEIGAKAFGEDTEIYLPWKAFNGNLSPLYPDNLNNWSKAETIASMYHPNWSHLKQGAKKLHTRNVFQVLGKNLDTPSKFVLCWAPVKSGVVQGGTGMAIRLAEDYEISIYNLYQKQK